jgi:hypothetical protein
MRVKPFASLVAAVLTLMLFAHRASADFSGPYTFAPNEGLITPSQFPVGQFMFNVGTWTLSGTTSPAFFNGYGPYMQAVQTEFYFDTGSPRSDGNYFEEISLTHTIAASGMLSFDYSVSLGSPYSPLSGDVAGYKIDGDLTVLPVGTGSVNVSVNQGDIFGFYLYAGPRCASCQPSWDSQTVLDVTNFSAPVPEPSTLTLFISAGASLAAMGVRRKRKN